MSEELLPRPQSPMVDRSGQPTPEWYDFLRAVSSGGSADVAQQIADILARLAQIEGQGAGSLTGINSVRVYGALADGATVQLDGDASPEPEHYYGTAAGDRGFHALTRALPPILIPEGESYTVPENRQALYSLPITVDGALVINGALVEV